MDRLRSSLREAPIVERDGYQYFVHPITDGVPALEPAILREVAVGVIQTATLQGVEKIVTPAAMGIHLSTAVSLTTDIPVVVVRKREYGLDGEVELSQQTGYDENELYINDVDPGDRVLVLDDVVSTGGTLSALTTALEDMGAEIVDVLAVIGKGGEDRDAMADSPYAVKTLVEVAVEDGEVVVLE
jgi:adenine phosphoribosyltransferase